MQCEGAKDAREVHDAAPWRLLDERQQLLRKIDGSEEICIKGLAQNGRAHRTGIVGRSKRLLGYAGIVDEEIEPAEVLIEVVVGFLVVGRRGDVKADGIDVSAISAQLLFSCLTLFKITRSDDDFHTLLPKLTGSFQANPAISASD